MDVVGREVEGGRGERGEGGWGGREELRSESGWSFPTAAKISTQTAG